MDEWRHFTESLTVQTSVVDQCSSEVKEADQAIHEFFARCSWHSILGHHQAFQRRVDRLVTTSAGTIVKTTVQSRQDKTRQGKARQGKTRPDPTRQDPTRAGYTPPRGQTELDHITILTTCALLHFVMAPPTRQHHMFSPSRHGGRGTRRATIRRGFMCCCSRQTSTVDPENNTTTGPTVAALGAVLGHLHHSAELVDEEGPEDEHCHFSQTKQPPAGESVLLSYETIVTGGACFLSCGGPEARTPTMTPKTQRTQTDDDMFITTTRVCVSVHRLQAKRRTAPIAAATRQADQKKTHVRTHAL